MARIRTVKPEFFTSEDIVSLSPLARLLYIAIWCEADKEGRLVWKPRTFKLRYLPGDACDADALCNELVAAGLVVLYGDGYAYIPSFARHQHINPRESASSLPAPDASHEELTRGDASARDDDAQGGREGKGREGNKDTSATPTLPCPYRAIVDAYHEALPSLPAVRLFDGKTWDKRCKAMREMWAWVLSSKKPDGSRRAETADDALAWLKAYFERAADNDFLMGRSARSGGHENWKCDLDFLLTEKGMRHVIEKTEAAA